MNAKKLIRETLRAELLADREPNKYVLNVSPGGIKVATRREYNLAMLAGMEDFWECIPFHRTTPEILSAFEMECDPNDGECCFPCIFDGHSKTYLPKGIHVVPAYHNCTMVTAKEVREVIDNAKGEAKRGDDGRSPSDNEFGIHGRDYTISPHAADELKRELMLFGNQHSYNFMTTVLKLIEGAVKES